VEPFFGVIVELGYDRSIPPWEPRPARLIPTLDPAKVTADLVNAIGEGFNNALAIIGLPPPPSIPAAADETTTADVFDQTTTGQQATDTDQTTTRQQTTVSTSEPWRRAGRHETPRPVVRGPLGVTASRSADCSTPAMQTRQPPRPRLTAMWPRPREPRRQNRLR
jgi:hypothetical protein